MSDGNGRYAETEPTGRDRPNDSGGQGSQGQGGQDGLSAYEARVSPFVERFAADLTEAGMQRMASRVFVCLLSSADGALSAAELGRRLQCSPAAVSGAVRYLAQIHMVSREREPGSRRERYRLHEDVWYESITTRDQIIARWANTLRTGSETLGPSTPEGRRLRETSEFFHFLQEEMTDMMARWRKRRDELRAEFAAAEAAAASDPAAPSAPGDPAAPDTPADPAEPGSPATAAG